MYSFEVLILLNLFHLIYDWSIMISLCVEITLPVLIKQEDFKLVMSDDHLLIPKVYFHSNHF